MEITDAEVLHIEVIPYGRIQDDQSLSVIIIVYL